MINNARCAQLFVEVRSLSLPLFPFSFALADCFLPFLPSVSRQEDAPGRSRWIPRGPNPLGSQGSFTFLLLRRHLGLEADLPSLFTRFLLSPGGSGFPRSDSSDKPLNHNTKTGFLFPFSLFTISFLDSPHRVAFLPFLPSVPTTSSFPNPPTPTKPPHETHLI